MGSFWVFIIISAAVGALAAGRKRKRISALARLGQMLGGALGGGASSDNVATGHHRGVAITHRMVSRGSGSSCESWTELECEPGVFPVVLHVEPHARGDADRIARGEMIDLEIGDPAFDPAFRVEAAPADIVARILDSAVRAYLLAHPRAELATHEGVLRLSVPGWIEDPDHALAGWDTLIAVRSNIRTAYETTVPAPAVVGSPFRPAQDDSAFHALEATRQRQIAEVAEVRSLRKARDAASARRVSIIFVCGFILVMALRALTH
jgi:hypothetical protein